MFRQIYNRELGHWKQNLLPYQKLPDVASSAFLERFETADKVHLYQPFSDFEFDLMIPMACNFGKVKWNLLGVSDEMGKMVIFNTDKSLSEKQAVVQELDAHTNAIFDFQWVDDDTKLLTASGDQTAALWDVERGESVSIFRGHFCSVRSVSSDPRNSALFATGARDGHILFWDSRIQTKVDRTHGEYRPPVRYICNAHSIVKRTEVKAHRRNFREKGPILDTQQSVTCLQFLSDHLLMSSGSVDGSIKVWDLRKSYTSLVTLPTPLQCFTYPGTTGRRPGVICFALDKTHSRVFATYTDHAIYGFNLATGDKNPVSIFKGHRCDTYYVKTSMSPDGRYLLSGSTNSKAYIWEVDKPEKAPVVLKGHMSDVGGVAWHPRDLTKLATVGDDSMLLLWNLPNREPSEEKQRSYGYAKSLKVGKKPEDTDKHRGSVFRGQLDPEMIAALEACTPDKSDIPSPSVPNTSTPSHPNKELNVYYGLRTAASTPPHMCVMRMRDNSIPGQESPATPTTCCPVTIQEDMTPGRHKPYPPVFWVGELGKIADANGTDVSNDKLTENKRATHRSEIIHSMSSYRNENAESVLAELKENKVSSDFGNVAKDDSSLAPAFVHLTPTVIRPQGDLNHTGEAKLHRTSTQDMMDAGLETLGARFHSTTLKRKLYADMDDMLPEKEVPVKFPCLSPRKVVNLAEQSVVQSASASSSKCIESSMKDFCKVPTVTSGHQNDVDNKLHCLQALDTNSPTKKRPLGSPSEGEPNACPYFNSVLPKPQTSSGTDNPTTHVLFTFPTKASQSPTSHLFYSPTMNLPNRVVDPPVPRFVPASLPSEPTPKLDWLTTYRLSFSTSPTIKTSDTKKSAATPSPSRTKRLKNSTPKSKENHASTSTTFINSPHASRRAGGMSTSTRGEKSTSSSKKDREKLETSPACSSSKIPGKKSIRHYFH
ncbi:denticleless protein homolog isoform X2 [Pomacea canaliculata]|uniref:denticleless protein homolog isoform X2 n=1 Tax=Pomacea canaliculata TaxID=400727 RepID=UPI000D73720B|nr:denticleless protein homolog isoform X2 [Pomacea canaliculata]